MAVNSVHDFTGRSERSHRVQTESRSGAEIGQGPAKQSFADLLKGFAGDVNDLQFQAGHAVDMLASGQAADVHQVMIAVEEAGIALDLMLEIRNRVLEGYQELTRMQE